MLKSIDKWLCGYLRSVARRPRTVESPRHLIFCIADHFEPFRKTIGPDGVARGGTSADDARCAVKQWTDDYRESVRGIRDSDGQPPRHTFFYPREEYDPGCLDLLAGLTGEGLAEVEIHLHHRNDTADGLREKLIGFRDTLRAEHGLLGEWADDGGQRTEDGGHTTEDGPDSAKVTSGRQPTLAYGFVHGNWALCNSRPDGDWCGVNEELGVLAETGCYADFTFPSAPSPTQPRMVNSIYWASDRSGKPRGHDRGRPARVGECGKGDFEHPTSNVQLLTPAHPHTHTLLLIQGPLGLNWRRRKWGVVPRLEAADLSAANSPSPVRADLWVRQHVHVRGRPDWVFVKLSTHGAIPGNARSLHGSAMRSLHDHLQSAFNDRRRWCLHYVSAREAYNIARSAEDGRSGNPASYRDYEISPPPCA